MMPSPALDVRVVEGIQFKVLTQVFPVLRHDAVKPLSNAKLTTVLLEKSIAKGVIVTPEAPPFVTDLDTMLDEGVEAIRLLNDWFHDDGRSIAAHRLLHECRKLAFSLLLLSGKKVQIAEFEQACKAPHRTGRYVIMAWLIHAIQSLPERGILQVEQETPRRIRGLIMPADPDAIVREPRPDTSAPMPLEDVQYLARFYGWSTEETGDGWTLTLPADDA